MKNKLGKVICNSSPFIGLAILNIVHVLWDIFDEVIVPTAVFTEITKNGRNHIGKIELEGAISEGKIHIYSVKDELFVNRFLGKLHRGELEVISAAKELDAQYLLLDDKAARTLAETLLLEPSGLIGLLKILKLTNKIDSIKPYLDKLIENGYWISKKLYNELLKDVGENTD